MRIILIIVKDNAKRLYSDNKYYFVYAFLYKIYDI